MTKTFRGVSEVENKCLMRCAGVIRKEGWASGSLGMVVYLSGPSFYYDSIFTGVPGYYSKKCIREFMQWQEEEFGGTG